MGVASGTVRAVTVGAAVAFVGAWVGGVAVIFDFAEFSTEPLCRLSVADF